jgi:hypothetical protein
MVEVVEIRLRVWGAISMQVVSLLSDMRRKLSHNLLTVSTPREQLYSKKTRQRIQFGRAIAQAVSHWLPTVAARVRARVRSCGIYGGQSGTGAGFLQVVRFPLPILIPPVVPQSPSSVIWGWYNRPVVAAVPSGLSLTPLKIIIKIPICYPFIFLCESRFIKAAVFF